MKGDFTRQAFRPRNHYRGVLQQQGRVQLDADWNEQVLLQAYLDRLVTEDTIGPQGAPEHAAGMAIVDQHGKPPAGPLAADDLRISPGHYYVHGILCENEDLVPLGAQPDLPGVGLTTGPRGLHRLPGRVAPAHHLGGGPVAARGGAGRPGHGHPDQDGLAGAGAVREAIRCRQRSAPGSSAPAPTRPAR